MKNAFVTGGSGFVGASLIRQLVAQNVRVVALARSEAAAAAVKKAGAGACRGDLLDERAITEGMRGCDTVFHVAGHLSEWDPYEVFHKANVVGTRTMLATAKAAGASTFVAVGAAAVVMGQRTYRKICRSRRPHGDLTSKRRRKPSDWCGKRTRPSCVRS
jgi:nucleoside-diphosphate-sugar epimerase